MSNSQLPPFSDPAWLDAQRRYWQAWSDLSKTVNPPPWSQAIDNWWTAVADNLSGSAHERYGHFIAHGRRFFQMAEKLAALNNRDLSVAETTEALVKLLQGWQQEWLSLPLPMAPWLHSFPGLEDVMNGTQNVAGWRELMTGYRQIIQRWLEIPSLGLSRGHHQRARRLLGNLTDIDAALREFAGLQEDFVADVTRRLAAALKSHAAGERALPGLRELYDLWVECAEAAYRELITGPKHSRIYGQLVNALLHGTREARSLIDDSFRMVGMPTRSETDSLLQEIQILRRQITETRSTLSALDSGLRSADAQAQPIKAPKES
jgi:class III poly(R)-hydroxyalkanoic acid synthase PhaE subunit